MVISAGSLLIIKDDRFKLHKSDNTLELTRIVPQDAGDFVCQLAISGGETLELAHTVEVLGNQETLTKDLAILKVQSTADSKTKSGNNFTNSILWWCDAINQEL